MKLASQFESSQLFITSHSPTLTSKVPFANLILLDRRAYRISNLFANRASENLLEAASPAVPVTDSAIQNRKNQLERYIDVTKSQLFFAKAILMVEGISEELLMNAFAQVAGFALEDFRIEIVNVDGTSFHPFLYLFNSGKDEIRIQKNVAILTDGDRFPMSKDLSYKFESLIENNYEKLNELVDKISAAPANNRSSNLASLANGQPSILIGTSHKTLEHELALMNVPSNRLEIPSNFLIKYVEQISSERHTAIMTYIKSLPTDLLSPIEIRRAAILIWKSLPSKAEFAQNFSIHILNNLLTARSSLIIPDYIMTAFNHLK